MKNYMFKWKYRSIDTQIWHISHSLIIVFFIRIKRKFYWGPMYLQDFCSADIYYESSCEKKRKRATYTLAHQLRETTERWKLQKTFLDQMFAKSKGDACRVNSFAFHGWDKQYDLKYHGEQSAYFILQFTVLPEEKSGQELKEGMWLVLHSSLSLFFM